MKKVIYILVILAVCSCYENKSGLELALESAGDNRSELEKVIAHYSMNPNDSLKLRAAEFLIENMPYHYSYKGKYAERYYHVIDSISRIKKAFHLRLFI